MIAAAKEANKKLMIGYRLHYEPFNQKVMELCRQQAIGTLKTFSSSNCQDVKAPNIRLSRSLGGGPVGDGVTADVDDEPAQQHECDTHCIGKSKMGGMPPEA